MDLIFIAFINSDQAEGDGHQVMEAAFKTHNNAIEAVSGKLGAEVRPLRLFASVAEYHQEASSDLKKSALIRKAGT